MTILYFTSTGNCLSVAKELGGNLISIPQAIRTNTYDFSDDSIGIIVPVYGLCVPPYILEFLKKVHFQCQYTFAILTYGFYAGSSCKQLISETKDNIHFNYVTTFKMVENYLPGFDMTKETKKGTAIPSDSFNQIKTDIYHKSSFIKKDSALDQFMTWTHKAHYAYPCGTGMTVHYQITENCSGCGICQKVCPMNNIKLNAKNLLSVHNALVVWHALRIVQATQFVFPEKKAIPDIAIRMSV